MRHALPLNMCICNSGDCLPSIPFIQAWLTCLKVCTFQCATSCVCVAAVSVNPFVILLHFSQFHHYHQPQNPPLWALLNPLKEKKRQRAKEKVSSWEGWHKAICDYQNNDRLKLTALIMTDWHWFYSTWLLAKPKL